MLVTLAASAALAFLGVRRVFRTQLDGALRSAAELQVAVLATGQPIPRHPRGEDLAAFVSEVNRFVVQRDRLGQITGAGTPHARTLPLDSVAFATALAGQPAWATIDWAPGLIRSVFVPAPAQRVPDAVVIQVAALLAPYYRASRVILAEILSVAAIAIVATFVGARWVAGSVTRIVGEIAEEARGVDPAAGRPVLSQPGQFRELQKLVQVLNETLGRQHAAAEQQRQLIADVAHELRTPVTALLGSVEVALRSTRSPEAYRQSLVDVQDELDHLAAIVESLLLLARLDAGQARLRVEEVDLAHLAQEVVTRARARAGGRRLEVEHNGSAVVRGDRKMLRLLLEQLVDNVIRHTPDVTVARISLNGQESAVILAVDDSGPGMEAEFRSRAFDRFVRGDPARTRTGGAGLGLTVAAAVMAAHGGTITGETSPLGGFRVLAEVPLAGRRGQLGLLRAESVGLRHGSS